MKRIIVSVLLIVFLVGVSGCAVRSNEVKIPVSFDWHNKVEYVLDWRILYEGLAVSGVALDYYWIGSGQSAQFTYQKFLNKKERIFIGDKQDTSADGYYCEGDKFHYEYRIGYLQITDRDITCKFTGQAQFDKGALGSVESNVMVENKIQSLSYDMQNNLIKFKPEDSKTAKIIYEDMSEAYPQWSTQEMRIVKQLSQGMLEEFLCLLFSDIDE